MAWKGKEPEQQDFSQLLSILNNSRLQTTNPPAYQVIKQLIDNAQRNKDITINQINNIVRQLVDNSTTVVNIAGVIQDSTFLTATNESAVLPNSRELLPGTNVTFDDTVANERTLNVSAASADYVVLSDGGLPTPLPIDDGFGNFIYVAYTP